METIELLKEIVIRKYTELQSYTKVFNDKAQKDMHKIASSKELFSDDPSKVNIDEIGRDILFLNGFHQVDIRKMQDGLLMAYNLYKEVGGEDTFDKEILETVSFLKASLPKQFFVCTNGNFEEIEAGRLEKVKEDYKEKNYYKMFESRVKEMLADE